MSKATVYNQTGEKVEEITLDKAIFGIKVKPEVIWQVVIAQRANARIPWAHSKDRSEVRGGGKKPWRQKGTGRARHGSSRSPIWIGGGVTFGPRKDRNYKVKVNKKVKKQALLMALTDKGENNNITVLDDLKLGEIKTKELFKVLQVIKLRSVKKKSVKKVEATKSKEKKTSKKPKEKIKSVLLITEKKDDNVVKSARNISRLEVAYASNLNLLKVVNSQKMIVTKKALAEIKKVYS
ncbi:50S ribosomal protein L4 [Patescibacteria group bacterium]|nr:50S ribosomal protein L4 [Patescibacteria group bacterium]